MEDTVIVIRNFRYPVTIYKAYGNRYTSYGFDMLLKYQQFNHKNL